MSSDFEQPLVNELESVIRNAGFAFGGIIFGSALRYGTQVLVARSLGSAEYGRFALGLALVSVAAMIAELGLPQGLVRFVAVDHGLGDGRRLKGTILVSLRIGLLSGAAVALMFASISSWLADGIFHDPIMSSVLVIMAISLPLATPTTMLVSAFQGFRRLEYKMMVKEVVDPLVRGIMIAACLWFGGRLLGVVVTYVATAVACLAAGLILLGRVFPAAFSRAVVPVYETGRLLHFSWPLLLIALMGNIFFVTDAFFLGVLRGPAEVGLYSAAQKTALFCGTFYASFISILGPIAADYCNRNRTSDLASLVKIVSEWSFTVTLPFTLALAVLAPSFMSLFGSAFRDASMPLLILAIGWAPHALLGTTGTILVMSGRARLHLANFVGLSFFNIVANLFMIPRFGLVGAAVATTVSMLLLDVVTAIELGLTTGMHPFRKDLVKPLVAGGLATVPIVLIANVGANTYPVVMASLGTLLLFALYAGALVVLGRREEEKRLFRAMRGRLLGLGGS